jgi:hypothetical protein
VLIGISNLVISAIGSEREILIESISTNFWLYELAVTNANRDDNEESSRRISKNASAFAFLVFINLKDLRNDDSSINTLLESIKQNSFLKSLELVDNPDPLGIMNLYNAEGGIVAEPTQFNFCSKEMVSNKDSYKALIAQFREWLKE